MVLVNWLVLAIHYFLGHCERVSCTEWLSKSHEFIDNTAKRPNIGFLGIGLRLDDLGARVKDGSYEGFHDACRLGAPAFGKTEVCQLQVEISVDEDVSRRQVSMDDPFFNV